MLKLNRFKLNKLRFYVQIFILILCVWIGLEFTFFVKYLQTSGASGFATRPAGVEGFLPISSFMNFIYFLRSGNINMIHPAGFFIFSASLIMSFIIGKSFCSWICPIGFISEKLADLGEKLFKRKLKIPKFLDYFFRSFKYLLLGFLAWAILQMNVSHLSVFLNGPYNKIADIKMYYFFAEISQFSLIVLLVLAILSFVLRGFWCRYLCPYGALLGIVGLFSPNKITRKEETCINCSKCSKVCPSFIKVDKLDKVVSDECTSCMKCVLACPVKDTLNLSPVVGKKTISFKKAAIIVITTYFIVIIFSMLIGKWNNEVSEQEYFDLHKLRNELSDH